MMRMLNNDEARQLFQTARVVRLGCIVNGEPYVVPINCHLEGDYLYSHSLSGMKIAGLRERSEERRVGTECRSRWSPYH